MRLTSILAKSISFKNNFTSNKCRGQVNIGQSMTEYLVLLALVIITLLIVLKPKGLLPTSINDALKYAFRTTNSMADCVRYDYEGHWIGCDEDEPSYTEIPGSPLPPEPSPVIACGNGSIDAGEECDDGGREAGDGCRADCLIEACSWQDAGGSGVLGQSCVAWLNLPAYSIRALRSDGGIALAQCVRDVVDETGVIATLVIDASFSADSIPKGQGTLENGVQWKTQKIVSCP